MAKKAAAKRSPSKKTEAKPRKRTAATLPVVAPPDTNNHAASCQVLERLHGVILDRRGANPATSHSARLLARGVAKVAQKFGEEAVECLIEAVAGDRAALIGESADVLYHLLVMWVAAGVTPEQVWAELERRKGVSGIAEKAARAKSLGVHPQMRTTKIP